MLAIILLVIMFVNYGVNIQTTSVSSDVSEHFSSNMSNVEQLPRVVRSAYLTKGTDDRTVVMIVYKDRVVCTGSLVSDTMLLTAARCAYWQGSKIRPLYDIKVYGVYDSLKDAISHKPEREAHVTEIILHPDFDCCERNDYDVALFKVTDVLGGPIRHKTLRAVPLSEGQFHDCSFVGYPDDGEKFTDRDLVARPVSQMRTRDIRVRKLCPCKNSKGQERRIPFICQVDPPRRYEIGFGDSGSALKCDGQTVGLFSVILTEEFQEDCDKEDKSTDHAVRMFDRRALGSYTVAFTDLCLNLRFINEHLEEPVNEDKVDEKCGEEYEKHFNKLRGRNKQRKYKKQSRRSLAVRNVPTSIFVILFLLI